MQTPCVCGAPYYGHRPKGGACYDDSFGCNGFRAATNPTHRYAIAKRRTVVYRDHKYDSQAEASYAQELQWRKEAKDIVSWEPHPLLNLEVEGVVVGKYRIDFKVKRKDGITEYVEVKGRVARTPLWAWKWKVLNAMYRNHPTVVVRLVEVR